MAMTNIDPMHLNTVRSIFAQIEPAIEVVAFGSRVRGDNHKYSDLDLAIQFPNTLEGQARTRAMTLMDLAFKESELPFSVDLLDLDSVNSDFKELILRTGQRIY